MMHRSHINTVLIIAAIAGFIIAAGLYAFLYHESGMLASSAVTARDEVAGEERGVAEERNLRMLSQSTEDMRARLPGYFVPLDNAVVFIQEVEAAASHSGATISIASISTDPSASADAAPGTVGTLTAHVNLTGSWQAVMRALELLEALPYRSTIDQLSMDTSVLVADKPGDKPSGSQPWQVSLQITAATLVRSPEERAAATTTQP